MKILIVVSTLGTGGAQRVASNLILGMPQNCKIDIMLNDSSEIVYPYKGRIIDLGLKPEMDKGKLSYQMKVFAKRIVRLKSLKNHEKYDATISFLDSANIANIITGNKKCKTIVTVHSKLSASSFDWRYKYIVFPLIKIFYRRADHVIAVSKGAEDDLRNKIGYYSNNLRTIYNGFDFNTIREKAKEPISDEHMRFFINHKTVIAVGRLTRPKGYWHLIRAMKPVVDKNPDVMLLIAGEGEQREYLTRLVSDLRLTENVIFLGFVDNPYKYIKKADAFVMSSIFEGLPSSMIEALSLEIPCVSTDFKSGAREILAPDMDLNDDLVKELLLAKYGILSPVCDGIEYDANTPLTEQEKLLGDGIEHIIYDNSIREEYVRKSSDAIKQFGIEDMVKSYIDLL